MFTLSRKNLSEMVQSARGIVFDEPNIIANLSNISAVLKAYLDDVNWAGFYIVENGELVLGPFQGLPACIRIKSGKGVCGTAFAEGKTQIVADVHEFPGHIACDGASNSEIVVPLFKNGAIWGVLDIDSPLFNRFGEDEANAITEIAKIVESFI